MTRLRQPAAPAQILGYSALPQAGTTVSPSHGAATNDSDFGLWEPFRQRKWAEWIPLRPFPVRFPQGGPCQANDSAACGCVVSAAAKAVPVVSGEASRPSW